MCPFFGGSREEMMMWGMGIKVFLFVWIIFVPIAVTSRLEKIIKLLRDKQNKS